MSSHPCERNIEDIALVVMDDFRTFMITEGPNYHLSEDIETCQDRSPAHLTKKVSGALLPDQPTYPQLAI